MVLCLQLKINTNQFIFLASKVKIKKIFQIPSIQLLKPFRAGLDFTLIEKECALMLWCRNLCFQLFIDINLSVHYQLNTKISANTLQLKKHRRRQQKYWPNLQKAQFFLSTHDLLLKRNFNKFLRQDISLSESHCSSKFQQMQASKDVVEVTEPWKSSLVISIHLFNGRGVRSCTTWNKKFAMASKFHFVSVP